MLVLSLVGKLGELARDQIRNDARFSLPLLEITCEPPPGMGRRAFLAEVQYLAELPDRLALLDPALPTRLRAAFADHPWVREVERIEVRPPGHVQVWLRYRSPVMSLGLGGKLRVVDADGVLLPPDAPPGELPTYTGPGPTAWRSGASLGEPVISAARLAEDYRPYLVEVADDGWVTLHDADGGQSHFWIEMHER